MNAATRFDVFGVARPVRLAIGFGLTLCLLSQARAQSLLTTNGNFFAWPDTEAPGLPGVYFGGAVDHATLAEDGTLAFRADLYGAGTSGINSRALFKGTSAATLAMLARWNDPAPGLPGLSLMNSAGTKGIEDAVTVSPSSSYILWSSYLSGPGVTTDNDSALYESSPGGHLLIAREGAPAPGTAGAVYAEDPHSGPQFSKINRHGTVVFYSRLAGGDVVEGINDFAYFTGTPGAVSMLLRQGDTVLPGPVTAAGLGYVLQLDNNGRMLYTLQLSGPGVTNANNDSIWIYTPGSGNQLLVREGDPAPGTAGAVFSNQPLASFPGVSSTSLTRSGRYEFTSGLTGGDVIPGVNDRALYAATVGGGLTMIARSGQPAPGTDAVFQGFSPFYSLINDTGDVAFQGTLIGGTSDPTNNNGIWIWRSGTLSLVVREGGPVPVVPPGLKTPGIAPGTTWDTFIGWLMSFNDLGQIVVIAGLQGGDVIPAVDSHALLAWDPTKGLFLVARSAEEIEFTPGNVRTTRLFSMLQYNNTDGVTQSFGKNGTLGLRVFLNEGSAVATVDLNCYPSTAYGIDADGDGYGDPGTRVDVCSYATPPVGHVPDASDCNDANPAVFTHYYLDADGDGYGDPALGICDDATLPAGYVIKRTDCDDTRAVVHPGAPDALCDGLDNNCNLEIDERFEPYQTTCGVGACASTGEAECTFGGVLTDSCTPGAPSIETCNGIDDNCDGTIDNAAVPTGTPSVALSRISGGAATLSWTNVSGATGYDVTRGSLVTLRSTLGNFTTATTNCLGNDVAATTINDLQSPAVGQGFWYALRAVSCGGGASYDSGSPKQVGSRDAEIAASGLGCP
jgi:hypothetical protein